MRIIERQDRGIWCLFLSILPMCLENDPIWTLMMDMVCCIFQWIGLFYLRVSLCYLRLVFVAYGQLAWSSLLTVKIWFGLFAYGGKSVWSSLRTVPPGPEISFGLFCLRLPPSGNWVWSFFRTVPPP